jgi:hypothetical protein
MGKPCYSCSAVQDTLRVCRLAIASKWQNLEQIAAAVVTAHMLQHMHLSHSATTCGEDSHKYVLITTHLLADQGMCLAHMLLPEHCWRPAKCDYILWPYERQPVAVAMACSSSAQHCMPGCTSSNQVIQVLLQLLN